jgi:RsiW-degrading membrane proteinase PrsW (M82 family)
MPIWLLVSAVIAPAIFWIGYFYYKDRFRPEPLVNMGLTYILGFGSGYACYKFYGLLPLLGIPADPSGLMEGQGLLFFGYCIGVVGVVEELFKFMPFIPIILIFKEFDEEIDGIIYASVLALGFASLENLHHLLYLRGFELFGRALATPLTHTVFASIWGYMVGRARLAQKSLFGAALIGLLISSLGHGIFDFLTLSVSLRLAAAGLILVIWCWRIYLIEKLHKTTSGS